ncbi:MAG TPA: hypothetical protein VG942_08745 [Hyphomonadaceae bacterium]|nr:hypothetical protein [Hyphomonadaceae bacterium]
MVRRILISALALVAATSVAAAPALAQRYGGYGFQDQDRRGDRGHGRDRDDHNNYRDQRGNDNPWNDNRQQERAPEREVPLSSVLRELKERYGGQHLDAQKVGNRYIISWVTGDGRRLTIEVDAASGRILSTR